MPQVVTWKAVVVGLLLIVAADFYINWSTVVLRASKNNKELFPMGLFFPYLILVAANLILSRVNVRWALQQGELCVALGMGLIGALFPFYGLASYMVGTIVAPSYFATPENSWTELLYPHLASWLVMDNSDGASRRLRGPAGPAITPYRYRAAAGFPVPAAQRQGSPSRCSAPPVSGGWSSPYLRGFSRVRWCRTRCDPQALRAN